MPRTGLPRTGLPRTGLQSRHMLKLLQPFHPLENIIEREGLLFWSRMEDVLHSPPEWVNRIDLHESLQRAFEHQLSPHLEPHCKMPNPYQWTAVYQSNGLGLTGDPPGPVVATCTVDNGSCNKLEDSLASIHSKEVLQNTIDVWVRDAWDEGAFEVPLAKASIVLSIVSPTCWAVAHWKASNAESFGLQAQMWLHTIDDALTSCRTRFGEHVSTYIIHPSRAACRSLGLQMAAEDFEALGERLYQLWNLPLPMTKAFAVDEKRMTLKGLVPSCHVSQSTEDLREVLTPNTSCQYIWGQYKALEYWRLLRQHTTERGCIETTIERWRSKKGPDEWFETRDIENGLPLVWKKWDAKSGSWEREWKAPQCFRQWTSVMGDQLTAQLDINEHYSRVARISYHNQ